MDFNEFAAGHWGSADADQVVSEYERLAIMTPEADQSIAERCTYQRREPAALAAEPEPSIVVLISIRDRGAYRRKLAATPARAFLPKGELSLQTFDQAVGS
jgi:hypothetical protein